MQLAPPTLPFIFRPIYHSSLFAIPLLPSTPYIIQLWYVHFYFIFISFASPYLTDYVIDIFLVLFPVCVLFFLLD
ncbi:hypothetical protein HOY80DRAFT_983751 [Tuber brumale]|nr:hypothetical protein HOY80DRAFT_983751 [Tuber brumale]